MFRQRCLRVEFRASYRPGTGIVLICETKKQVTDAEANKKLQPIRSDNELTAMENIQKQICNVFMHSCWIILCFADNTHDLWWRAMEQVVLQRSEEHWKSGGTIDNVDRATDWPRDPTVRSEICMNLIINYIQIKFEDAFF